MNSHTIHSSHAVWEQYQSYVNEISRFSNNKDQFSKQMQHLLFFLYIHFPCLKGNLRNMRKKTVDLWFFQKVTIENGLKLSWKVMDIWSEQSFTLFDLHVVLCSSSRSASALFSTSSYEHKGNQSLCSKNSCHSSCKLQGLCHAISIPTTSLVFK